MIILHLILIANNWMVCLFMKIEKQKDENLTGDLVNMDMATKENLENLVKVGEELLKKPVSRMNCQTGIYEPVDDAGTNIEALKK